MLGLERMNFATPEGELQLGIGTNFAAFERAAGGLLFMQLIKSSDLGMMFGGSHDSHRIARGLHWTYFSSVRRFHLNRGYELPLGEVWWKRLARTALRLRPPVNVAETARRVLCDGSLPSVEVAEESRFTEDLLPQTATLQPPFQPRCRIPQLEIQHGAAIRPLPAVSDPRFREDGGLRGHQPAAAADGGCAVRRGRPAAADRWHLCRHDGHVLGEGIAGEGQGIAGKAIAGEPIASEPIAGKAVSRRGLSDFRPSGDAAGLPPSRFP